MPKTVWRDVEDDSFGVRRSHLPLDVADGVRERNRCVLENGWGSLSSSTKPNQV